MKAAEEERNLSFHYSDAPNFFFLFFFCQMSKTMPDPTVISAHIHPPFKG